MIGFRLILPALVAALIPAGAAVAKPDACRSVRASRPTYLLKVPFRTVSGRIYVEARVNGKGPFTFAIDTGASGMGRADLSLTKALALPVGGTGETSDGVNSAVVDLTRFQSLDLGGFIRTDVEVIARDYSSKAAPEAAFSGIIGREFFADGLLIIDYPTHTITFTRTLRLPRKGKDVLGYERAFRVPVSIGGVQVEGNIDTGANVTFAMPGKLFNDIGGGALETAGRATLTNTKIETSRATVKGPFKIGNAILSNVDVRVSDRFPELVIGAHVLQNYAVLIDQRSKSIALCDRRR